MLMTDYPPNGPGQGYMNIFYSLGPRAISLQRMKLDISNLVCRLNINSTEQSLGDS